MISRYRTYSEKDDGPLGDGDNLFRGFVSRVQPTSLPATYLQYAANMRLERGTAKVRAGLDPQSHDITLINPPLVLDFPLASDKAVTSITRAVNTATVTTTAPHGYTTGNYVNIRGATQTDYNGDHTITVTGASAFTYTVANTPATPATGTIVANKGPRVYANYASGVRGSCHWSNTSNAEGIVIASTTEAYLYRDGASTATLAYPAGETVDTTCDMVQYVDKVYIFRGYSTAAVLAVTSITSALGIATVTTTASHGLVTNNWVTIAGATQIAYNGIFQITVTGAATFTYFVSFVPASPATGTITARPCQPAMSWDGNTANAFVVVTTGAYASAGTIIRMPAVDWGVSYKQRLVLPYSRDELIISDILDANSYETINSQLRIMPGSADWLVAVQPFQDYRLLILYKYSLHLLQFNDTSGDIEQVSEVSRSVGCFARKTVTMGGMAILWLSDIGVMRLDVNDYLNAKALSVPLSDPIQDIINTINWESATGAVAIYYNNRYYLALPTGTQTLNQTILVYNFINEAWESVDSYPAGFDVKNWHIMLFDGQERLFAVATEGYVYLMEENDVDSWGSPGMEMDYEIAGQLQTRDYTAGNLQIKRFKSLQLDAILEDENVFSVTVVSVNPDYTTALETYTATSGTDVMLQYRLFEQGTSLSVTIDTTVGRPEFRRIEVGGAAGDRNFFTYT